MFVCQLLDVVARFDTKLLLEASEIRYELGCALGRAFFCEADESPVLVPTPSTLLGELSYSSTYTPGLKYSAIVSKFSFRYLFLPAHQPTMTFA